MSDQSARLGLPYLMPAQAQKHVTHNEALARLDLLVQLVVQAFEATEPPSLPLDGQIWALGPAPAGDWAGQAGQLAARVDGVWQFIAPQEGWRAARLTAAGAELRVFTAAGWVAAVPEALDNLSGLGVNAAHDATNRLAVAAAATLLSHDGADHRLTVNKAAPADTASLLFQTGWSGRAEMGTVGDDDFAVKVSADGTSWVDALQIDRESGRVSVPTLSAAEITGNAVTQSATDTTAGRLLTPGAGGVCGNAITLTSGDNLNDLLVSGLYFNPSAANAAGNNYPINYAGSVLNIRRTANNHTQRFSAFAPNSLPEDIRIFERSRGLGAWSPWVEIFHQGRILGTVSQSGGIPTGALFERGSNSNGEYVRFADGTQICSRTFSLPAPDSEFLSPSFPASFSAAPAVVLHAYIPDQSSGDRYANVAYAAVSSSEISGIRVRRVTPNSDAAIVTYHAIGRWF